MDSIDPKIGAKFYCDFPPIFFVRFSLSFVFGPTINIIIFYTSQKATRARSVGRGVRNENKRDFEHYYYYYYYYYHDDDDDDKT